MTQELLALARRERPEWLFAVLFDFDRDPRHDVFRAISALGTRTINWFCDDHWRFAHYSALVAPNFDLSVTTSASTVAEYRAIGLGERVLVSQWACNHDLYQPLCVPVDVPVSFVGQPYGERTQQLESLERAGIDVRTFGFGWPRGVRLPFHQMVRTFCRSRINLNLAGAYTGPRQQIKGRLFEIPGVRAFLLSEAAEGVEQYYQPDDEIVLFHDDADLLAKVRFYLNHESERRRIAQNGYVRTLREHTWRQRLAGVLAATGNVPTLRLGAKQAAGPLVSIVIPCFNQGGFLADAVASVIAQSYSHWECIIVDDGSTDDSGSVAADLVAQHDGLPLRLIRQANQGLARARNNGIAAARGDYLMPLDADDRLHPEMLARTVAVLEENPHLAFVYTDFMRFGSEDRLDHTGDYDLNTLLLANQITYCGLYRRRVFAAVGGYEPNMSYPGYEDWNFWISCGEKGFVGRRWPEPLFFYRVRPNSMFSAAYVHDLELKKEVVALHRGLYRTKLAFIERHILPVGSHPDLVIKLLFTPALIDVMRRETIQTADDQVRIAKALAAMAMPELALQWLRRAHRRAAAGQAPEICLLVADMLQRLGRRGWKDWLHRGVAGLKKKRHKVDLDCYRLGSASKKLGDLKGARRWLTRALRRLQRRDLAAGIHFHLGDIARQLGRLDQARQHLHVCLQAEPGHRQARADLASLMPRGDAP